MKFFLSTLHWFALGAPYVDELSQQHIAITNIKCPKPLIGTYSEVGSKSTPFEYKKDTSMDSL
ncbi:hypothetical protein Leryth_026328, partial [Lithospermum erythrorhizon]